MPTFRRRQSARRPVTGAGDVGVPSPRAGAGTEPAPSRADGQSDAPAPTATRQRQRVTTHPLWRVPRLTARGFAGPGHGRVSYVEAPVEWHGSTTQVCGLYPFVVGGGAPTVGVPLGPSLLTGATVCCDPISWFQRARLILNPSMFVLGLPALGKSTLVRRLVLGLSGQGVVPLVLGDLKPDYVDLVAALGGQILRLGRGLGSLNVLDAGALDDAAARLDGAGLTERAARLREEAHGRRLNMVDALIVLVRGSATTDTERTVLSAALRLLAHRRAEHEARSGGRVPAPLLGDLVALLEEAPAQVRLPTLDRGDRARYEAVVDPLQRSLLALVDGPLGGIFARPTSERLRLDAAAVCVDVSGISANDSALQAAVLLACWNEGFGSVEAANELADAGIAPQRRFFIVLDELWRVLRSGEGMVDKVDTLTRLNRQEGVGQAMISHSMADLRALKNEEDRAKATGFVERSGLVVVGGLPPAELTELRGVLAFTAAEAAQVTSWSTPPGWDENDAPPGRGKFLLKVGQRPGIPVRVTLTAAEHAANVHDTNKRWTTTTARAARGDARNADARAAGAPTTVSTPGGER